MQTVVARVSRLQITVPLFVVLLLVVGADLLGEKSIAGWLVAAGGCWFGVREKYCSLIEANRVSTSEQFCSTDEKIAKLQSSFEKE